MLRVMPPQRSLYADRSEPVVVCFDAGNLKEVGQVIYQHFPEHKHVFVADNDESKTGENKAKEACWYFERQGCRYTGANARDKW